MPHDELQRLILERLDDFCERLGRIESLLSGSDDPSKGLLIRVDRVEGFVERSRWTFRAMVAAMIGAVITFVYGLFSKHSK